MCAAELAADAALGRRRAVALPPRARRRGPGPQPGAAPPARAARRRPRRPVPRRRPGAGDLRLQRRRPRPAARRRRRACPASRSSPCPTNHRCTPQIVAAGAAVLRAGGQAARGDVGPRRRPGRAGRRRRRRGPRGRAGRRARPLARPRRRARRDGRRARPHERPAAAAGRGARRGRHPGARADQLAAGSPLAAARRGRRPPCRRPAGSRAWAHDVLDGRPAPAPRRRRRAERRVAAAVLEFLRDQPFGDGAALRSWLGDDEPVRRRRRRAASTLLTFHAAKGREWPTVVVTGVETGLVPHRSATTDAARAEEARLLHVAVTRAADRLVITWAARRGGYQRQAEPADRRHRHRRGADAWRRRSSCGPRPRGRDPTLEALAGVARAGRRSPPTSCRPSCAPTPTWPPSRAAHPTDADELAAVTSMGVLTAARLLPGIRAALDGARSLSRRAGAAPVLSRGTWTRGR